MSCHINCIMTINVTLAFPEAILKKIDRHRGDINRSKFVVRLLEFAYLKKGQEEAEENKKLVPRIGLSLERPGQSVVGTRTVAENDLNDG
jgi:hypothetical protein